MSQAGIPEEQIVRLGLISSPKTAIRLGRKYKAKIVMWGWYNDLEIHPNYEVVKLLPKIDLPETYKGTSEEELARFQLYLTRDLPSEYVALGFLTMGVIDYYDEKFEETLQSLEKAEDMLPESSRTISPRYFFLYRGNAFRRLQRYQDAVEEFDRAIALDPDNGDAIGVFLYKQRGLAYLNLGENEKAIADFDKSLGWEREQAVVFYNRGSAYYGLDLFDAALADFDQALAFQPSQNWAHFVYAMRGATYTHLARYEEALADANRAIELAQDASSGYFVRSVVYFKMGRLEMALADANKAIELDPRYIGAYYYRGQSYENLGDLRSARQDYQTAMDICATVGENDGVYTVHCERYGEEAMHGAQRVEEQLQ